MNNTAASEKVRGRRTFWLESLCQLLTAESTNAAMNLLSCRKIRYICKSMKQFCSIHTVYPYIGNPYRPEQVYKRKEVCSGHVVSDKTKHVHKCMRQRELLRNEITIDKSCALQRTVHPDAFTGTFQGFWSNCTLHIAITCVIGVLKDLSHT